MLFSIIKDDHFAECIEAIKNSFWPQDTYLEEARSRIKLSDSLNVKQEYLGLLKKIEEIIDDVSRKPLYKVVDGSSNGKTLTFPFIKYYHSLFRKRKIEGMEYDHSEKWAINDIFCLAEKDNSNSSRNIGNYNHFINVISYAARLIQYFSDGENIKSIISRHNFLVEANMSIDDLSEVLRYVGSGNMRSLKLLLAAYFHDIGKSVVDRRHAIEGSIIISDHTSKAWFEINQIVNEYKLEKQFDTDDLLFIADLIFHHDIFGTLSTGESGYVKFSEIIDKLKRYSKRTVEKNKQEEMNLRNIFDLWVLNVADILASLEIVHSGKKRTKWDSHEDIWSDKAAAFGRVDSFFKDNPFPYPIQPNNLVHDLILCFKLQFSFDGKRHTDNIIKLENEAYQMSLSHTVERLRRFVVNTLPKTSKNEQGKILLDYIYNKFTEEHQITPIHRAIDSVVGFRLFCERFSWIGQMDYAFGFFRKISEYALLKISEEISCEYAHNGDNSIIVERTRWVRENIKSGQIGGEKDLRDNPHMQEIQSRFFYNNYVAVVIQILGHILLKDRNWDTNLSLEFSDAQERLTNDKIEKIISFEGPYRYSQTINLLLQTVFIY